jgi:hypothetical protein
MKLHVAYLRKGKRSFVVCKVFEDDGAGTISHTPIPSVIDDTDGLLLVAKVSRTPSFTS